MRILSRADVLAAFPMSDAVAAMREAFAQLAKGEAEVPVRPLVRIPSVDATFLTMPAYASATPALSVKAVGVFPGNVARGLDRIQGVVVSFDPETGRPSALMEGSSVTALRTGAASGVATDLLARRDAGVLALFGAGVEARTHLAAMLAVRPVTRVRIVSRTRASAERMAKEVAGAVDEVEAASSPREALRDADIVCATTTSSTPVFDGRDLAEGVHVNAVGSFSPSMRELDLETLRRMDKVVVDTRHGAWSEAGELIHARDEGVLAQDGLHAELGEVVTGSRPGRESETERTLFKSVGNAVQDAVASAWILRAAQRLGLGVDLDLV